MESSLSSILVKNRYRLNQQLGKNVFSAIDTVSGEEVAVKIQPSNQPNSIFMEGKILRQLRD